MLDKKFREVNHSYSYHIADIIQSVVVDPFPYIVNLEGCFGEYRIYDFVRPYSKRTVLHKYIDFTLRSLFSEWVDEEISNQSQKLCYERAMDEYKIDYTPFKRWLKSRKKLNDYDADDVFWDGGYYFDIEGSIDNLFEELAEDIFHLMFTNRVFLQNLNSLIAGYVQSASPFDEEDRLEYEAAYRKKGVLKRKSIPSWCKKAVYFRDRGRCCGCFADLSNMVSLSSQAHYDHIIPLSQGGVNDVTNLQLLCESCNLKKGGKLVETSSKYEKWFE